MEIFVESRNGVAVAAPSGRLDSTTSPDFEHALTRILDANPRCLVVDFSRVDYISSAGLRLMLVAARRLGGAPDRLVICGLGEPVRQVFDLAGFLPLFTVEPSRERAVARAGG